MRRKSSNKILSFSSLLVCLVIIGLIGVIVYFTNGLTSDFKSFYIVVDGQNVLTDTGGYVFTTDKETTVDVKYVFSKVNSDIKGYSITISANADEENDFSFNVNDTPRNFSSVTDLSKGFIINQKEDSFTIKPKGNLDMILGSVFEGQTVSECSSMLYADMFVLTVTSYNKQSDVSIKFTIPYDSVGIVLDKDIIVF